MKNCFIVSQFYEQPKVAISPEQLFKTNREIRLIQLCDELDKKFPGIGGKIWDIAYKNPHKHWIPLVMSLNTCDDVCEFLDVCDTYDITRNQEFQWMLEDLFYPY